MKLGGVFLPHLKITEDISPQKFPSPKEVTLPMKMHIGKAANIKVSVGDTVSVGDVIGEASGNVSSNIHATVSGRVQSICSMDMHDGESCLCVKIRSDGEDRLSHNITVPKLTNRKDFIGALYKSGIVGLGGAGFPTYVKYDIGEKSADTLIVNCAECEPYITSDTHTLRDRMAEVCFAVNTIRRFYKDIHVIFVCERKSSILKWAREVSRILGCELKAVGEKYPQGAEKVMIYHTLEREVFLGTLPIDVGCIVSNVSTIAEVGKYLKTGIPLVRRLVTVDGDAVLCPSVVDVPIGTSTAELLEWCGGFKADVGKILFGGPMMGISVINENTPILKNVNAVTVLSKEKSYLPSHSPCIRCGSCLRSCPVSIDSAAVGRAVSKSDYLTAKRLGIEACIECGCCSYICPAKISLTENNKRVKQVLRSMKNDI